MVEATSADLILRVVDPSKLQVVASVPIPDLARVQVGKPVRVLVPGADAPEDGKVLTRPAAVDPTGVAAEVRISFNAGTKLAVGTPVRVEIVAEQRPAALAVPIEAILPEDEDAFVMVAGADNKAHKRKVTIGLTNTEAGRDHRRPRRPGKRSSCRGSRAFPTARPSRRRNEPLSAPRPLRARHRHRHGHPCGGGTADRVHAAERHLSPAHLSARGRDRPQRDDAGAIDDADRHPPDRAGAARGAGRAPRAIDDVPRRHGNLRAVRSRDRHDPGAPAGAGQGGGDPRIAATGARSRHRATDAVRVSRSSAST